MRNGKRQRWLCGLAVVVLLVGLITAWSVEKNIRGQKEAKREEQLKVLRYDRPVPIYSEEEGAEVVKLLQEQANRNRMDVAEKNENICVYYSLTGKIVHKENLAFSR